MSDLVLDNIDYLWSGLDYYKKLEAERYIRTDCEYNINFNVNGSMIATNGTVSTNGTWNIGYEGDAIYVEFIFDDETPFNDLNREFFK